MAHWVLQGNPTRWEDPHRLWTEPVTRWCVTGVQRQVAVGDGVLLWLANRDPAHRGVHAVARVEGEPTTEAGSPKPYVDLSVTDYVVHDPVSVLELRESAFATHPILRMARRTAYPCSPEEYDAAVALVAAHGPTRMPPAHGGAEGPASEGAARPYPAQDGRDRLRGIM